MNTNTVAQSDYAANAYTENVQQTTKKSAVTNGKTIGDPQLSEKAQKYYEQLKKKFSNMDFILVSADKKEEAQANAAQYANANHTVVLIDTDKCNLLEYLTQRDIQTKNSGVNVRYRGKHRFFKGFNEFIKEKTRRCDNDFEKIERHVFF